MRDLVVVSLEAWDDVWRRNQHLVAGLLRERTDLRVLFVEPAADPVHAALHRRAPRAGRGLRPGPGVGGVAPGPDGRSRLWLHQPTKPLPRRLDPRADERLAASVRRAVARLGMAAPALWINDPSGARLLGSGPALYDITDDWLAARRTPAEHARLVADEGRLLAECAEVVVCSAALVAAKTPARRAAGGAPVRLVTNGVDAAAYARRWPRPADLPAGRVALYAGTVHPDRFDVPLLLETARALGPAATAVLLGPVVDLSPAEHAALSGAGVVALGRRPFDQVPAYLQHADVLLVPHVVDAFTDSLDPIKLYEYRAAGRPVVATPVAGFRDAPDVTVADAGGFPGAVADALAASRPAAAGGVAPVPDGVPTWAGQARLMGEVLDALPVTPAAPLGRLG